MEDVSSTAGRGDPYWYEWFVGLAEVVRLLDPSSDVVSVAFQVQGVKGWDDVVVRLKQGKRCYQVKHTRSQDSLTFGDLLAVDQQQGASLLQSLFASWREGKLNDGATKCILYTNREAGCRWSTTKDGHRRPPLMDFWQWLQENLVRVVQLTDIVPDAKYVPAWNEWLAALSPGTDSERLAFLRALEIRDKQGDLEGLADYVQGELSKAFGTSRQRIQGVFDSLCRALRKWTTGHPGVTVEELCNELALRAEERELAPAPPPPSPFFPTRISIAENLERALRDAAEPVIFLTAEPGAGKTSVISRLTNRRVEAPLSDLVGARFFCFEPIRPENPVVAPDASRVHPEDLWRTLLSQLREGLRGRLHELQVPLRNDLLTWQEARQHVLRLADSLGRELRRPFVLVIDGIDHAARAAQTLPAETADFFASLPSPDELSRTAIRLLIAGQPPEHYPQYPAWLRIGHAGVKRMHLPLLQIEDVRAIYDASTSGISSSQGEAAVRTIHENAKGNTLATVFAVNEAESTSSAEELAHRLAHRKLADGLISYYSAIWEHMLGIAADYASGVDPCLAGTLSVARKGISPVLLHRAFGEWEKPEAWWRKCLEALGPLLTEGDDGFRVRHNDVRVFLSRRLAADARGQQRTFSHLANYFLRPESDRLAAHLQLFDLLRLAERELEHAEVFSVDWVLEGAMLGIEDEQLIRECRCAIHALPRRKDWRLVVPVACATRTLDRLVELREQSYGHRDLVRGSLPPFLPSEVGVRPVKQWRTLDFSTLVNDGWTLVQCGEPSRVRALLERWLDGLTICKVAAIFTDKITHFGSVDDGVRPMDESAIAPFEDFGRLCGTLGWRLAAGKPRSKVQTQALFAFEQGLVKTITQSVSAATLEELCCSHLPYYLSSWITMIRRLASGNQWNLVREALNCLGRSRDRLAKREQAEATWWALRSSTPEKDWLSPLDEPGFGMSSGRQGFGSEDMDHEVQAYINVARSYGWNRIGLDPGDIGALVFEQFASGRSIDRPASGLLALRTAAILAKIERAFVDGDEQGKRDAVSPSTVFDVLSALWSRQTRNDLRFGRITIDLASELAAACDRIGGDHVSAAIEAAMLVAQEFPVDSRKWAIWKLMERSGNHDLLRRWVRHWLDESGEAWHLPRVDLQEIVRDFESIARRIGEGEVFDRADDRRKSMLIGYRNHKEDAFSDVLDWFRHACRHVPAIWEQEGWKLWCTCLECDAQGGDNHLESEILDAVSAAALRCGASAWWRLASTTLSQTSTIHWHNDIRQRLVDGGALACKNGASFRSQDALTLWSLAVSFSLWTDKSDCASLKDFRETLLSSVPPTDRQQLECSLRALTPRAFIQSPGHPEVTEYASEDSAKTVTPARSWKDTVARIEAGEQVLLAEASAAICGLKAEGPSDEDELVRTVLRSIGCGRDYVPAWYFVESSVEQNLQTIVGLVSEDQLWSLVESLTFGLEHTEYWRHSVVSNLHSVAVARAASRGINELINGLDVQVAMHVAWAYGRAACDRSRRLPPLPDVEAGLDWQEVSLRLTKVVFDSYSAEVLGAALEGIHTLVATDETIVKRLFAMLTSEWSRRWLLNAAESWAALHPQAMTGIRAELEEIMNCGSLENALQAWIVLCRHSDAIGQPRPHFPIPEPGDRCAIHVAPGKQRILHSAPVSFGHMQLVDHHVAATSTLRRLKACGFDFSSLESQIAVRLNAMANEENRRANRDGPQRWQTIFCTPLDKELVVGAEVSKVINTSWCGQEDLCRLAQGFLSSEDAWLQRTPPIPAPELTWPSVDEYGSDAADPESIRETLKRLAVSQGIPDGWRLFAACAHSYTRKADFTLRLWWEEWGDSLVISPITVPTCPSGRTFTTWLGECFEPDQNQRFVSALFAGGIQRLHHCNVEMVPCKAWRETFGWEPSSTGPLTWCLGAKAVARYERLHGPLRDDPEGPRCRQPVLHRWLVSEAAFNSIEQVLGTLRLREHFEVSRFKT